MPNSSALKFTQIHLENHLFAKSRQPLKKPVMVLLALLPLFAVAQQKPVYFNENAKPPEQFELLLNGMTLNVFTGYTDIQYANYKLLPPEPTICTSVNFYLPIVRLMPNMALGAELGAYGAASLRLEDQYHIALPIMARMHYGAGAYSGTRKWLGLGAGFGLDPHWTVQKGERVGQETAMTGFLDFTLYQGEYLGMGARYQTSLMSAYFHKQQFLANMSFRIPF